MRPLALSLLAAFVLSGAALAREGDCGAGAPLWVEAACDIAGGAAQMGVLAERHMQHMPGTLEKDAPVIGFLLLNAGGLMAQFGGREPGTRIADAAAGLLASLDLPALEPVEAARIIAAADHAAPRDSVDAAAEVFIPMVEARGAKFLYMSSHGWFVVPEQVWCKWRDTRLAPGLALTDWHDLRDFPDPEMTGKLRDTPNRNCGEMILS